MKNNIKSIQIDAKKVKEKVSNLLLKKFKRLKEDTKKIIDLDISEKILSKNHLKNIIIEKLRTNEIELNISDLKDNKIQFSFPSFMNNKEHVYILPNIREEILKNLSDKEINTLKAIYLCKLRQIEEKNYNIARQFSLTGTSPSKHKKAIEEIDIKLKTLI